MTSKTCFKCGAEKPLSDFYKHPSMADGHLNKCKSCTKRDVHERRHGDGRERILAYDRERARRPERVAKQMETTAKWNAEHADRRAAHSKLAAAVKSGRVVPWPVCAMPCCSQKPEAHHPDYGKPLDVVWLCSAHHKQAHAIAKYDKTQEIIQPKPAAERAF